MACNTAGGAGPYHDGPRTPVGTLLGVVVPLPSWPSALRPQQKALPPAATPQLCDVPVLIERKWCSPGNAARRRRAEAELAVAIGSPAKRRAADGDPARVPAHRRHDRAEAVATGNEHGSAARLGRTITQLSVAVQ